MAIDPEANAAYHDAKNIKLQAGQSVWVLGLEFRVVSVQNGQLLLEPVNAKI